MALGDPYVNVEELKDYAQITDSVDDTTLTQITVAVSNSVNDFCHRQFNDAGSATPRTFDVYDPWYLRVDDFSTTAGLVVKTDTGNNGGFASTITAYTAYPLNGIVNGVPGYPYNELVLARTTPTWPIWMPNPYGPLVQVTARWGWTAVPPEVKQACLIKCAKVFKRRYSIDGVVGTGDFAFRVSRFEDPDVAELLMPLRPDLSVIA